MNRNARLSLPHDRIGVRLLLLLEFAEDPDVIRVPAAQ